MHTFNSNVFAGLSAEQISIFANLTLVSNMNDLLSAIDHYKDRLKDQSLTERERAHIESMLKATRATIDKKIQLTSSFYNVPSLVVTETVAKAVESISDVKTEEKKDKVLKKAGKLIKAVFTPELTPEEKKEGEAVQQQLFEETENASEKSSVKTPELEFDRFPVLSNDALMQLFELFVIRDGKLYHEDEEITSLFKLESILLKLS